MSRYRFYSIQCISRGLAWLNNVAGVYFWQTSSGTVKRPKFGNGPLVRHPLSKLLKNHISARTGVRDLAQRGDWLYIFFWTNKKINNWG